MATSGSVDFSVSRNEIILAALQDLGITGGVDTVSSASFTTNVTAMAMKLNMLVKLWSGQSDFAPGIKMWSRKRAYLFLCGGQNTYTLGPTTTTAGTTNKWASSYVTTTLSGAEAAGQTVISLTDATGIVATNRIGIELDSGVMQWTTVAGVSSNDVTIGNALDSAAGSGNRVFAYAVNAQGRRPISILSASLRDTDGNDTPVNHQMSIDEYESISSKSQDSDPSRLYYETTLTDGTVYLDAEPSDITKVIRIVYLSPIEDFDAENDTPDYDQNWYLPLVLGLAEQSAMMFGRGDKLPAIRTLLYGNDRTLGALTIAKNANPERSTAYYECDAPV